MAGKFSVSSSNVIMPLYTAELFPTVIRNLGVGTSNIPAGIALIMVPYLWNLVSPVNIYLNINCILILLSIITVSTEQSFTVIGTGNSQRYWWIICTYVTRNRQLSF